MHDSDLYNINLIGVERPGIIAYYEKKFGGNDG